MIDEARARIEGSTGAAALGGHLAAVLDAVADGVTVQDRHGRLIYANAAAVRLIGFESPDELLATSSHEIMSRFDLFDESGAPLPLDALPGRRALEGVVEPAATIGFRIRATGAERWALVRATPLLDDGGGVAFAINTFHDITDRVRIEVALRASEARYRQLVEAMPQVAWMTDATGAITMANGRWAEYAGSTPEPGDPLLSEGSVHPDDREAVGERWRAALDEGSAFEAAGRIRRADGRYLWHLLRATPVRDANGRVISWIGTNTDVDATMRAEQGLRILARATERLDATLELIDTLDAGASVAVPDLADWCIIDLLEPDGATRRAAIAAADAELGPTLEAIRAFPTDPRRQGLGATALRTGRPVLIPTVTRRDLERIARSPEHAALLERLGPRSMIAVPLLAHGGTLGVLLLAAARSGRRYDLADLDLAVELAVRIGAAISNAQLFAGEQAARRAAERAAERIERLQRAAGRVAAAYSRDEAASAVLRSATEALGASGGVLALRGNDLTSAEVVVAEGLPPDLVDRWRRFPLESRFPLADAVRTARPVWVPRIAEAEAGPEDLGEALRASTNASMCAVPIVVEGRAIGALGLVFPDARAFDEDDRRFITAHADLAGQALDRVALSEARESLLAGLEEQRGRLETVLRQMPAGVIIAEAPSGRMLLTNEAVREIWGGEPWPAADVEEYVHYRGFHADGRPIEPDDWPLARAMSRGETVADEEIEFLRQDGTHGWMVANAAPIRDRDGRVVAGVVTFLDVTDRRRHQENQRFLADASEVLGASLDFEEAIGRVAQLAVPRVGDWCAVDLVDDDGRLRHITSAHVDPSKMRVAQTLRERYPPDPASPVGPWAVVRSGEALLVPDITPEMLASGAVDEEHLRLLEDLGLRSYMCVPLRAGDRTAGTITFVGAESGRRYGADDLAFAEDLAARASAAIERARLFREAGRATRMVDASLDAVFTIDPATLRFAYVNAGAVDQLGYDRATLLGMSPADVTVELDREALGGLLRPLVDGSLESRTVTVTHRHRSGREVPVEILLQRVAFPGEGDRVVAVARDISERVEAQARLQRLADAEHARAAELNAVIRAMGDGIVVCDPRGAITLANPAAHALFDGVGLRSYEAILERLEEPGRAPRLGARSGPIELRLAGADERWIELSTFPVGGGRDASGVAGAETIVLLRDVTAPRQRQAVRDTFLGVLSHELRTPITTIFAASKVLARPESALPEETRREIFDDIRVEAERLHRLVEDVIALTRFGEEDVDIGQEPVLLQRVLPSVARSEEARWPSATFRVDVPPGLPTVVADPTYVEQVVRNLLSNAAKYGGPEARIDVEARAEEDEVVVRILDDGPGFAAGEADRLFELFYRSSTTAGVVSGAGIGLFVCARLIRSMGGRIWARPRPDGGAEFGFSLRVMPDD